MSDLLNLALLLAPYCVICWCYWSAVRLADRYKKDAEDGWKSVEYLNRQVAFLDREIERLESMHHDLGGEG